MQAADLPPVLDLSNLAALGMVLSLDKVGTYLVEYIVDTELHLVDLASCRADRDLEGVARIACGIASNARNFGAMRASDLARQLADVCGQGEIAGTYHLIGALSDACHAADRGMMAWLVEQARRSRES